MANKTFVAKNGLTANTASVFFSELATNLTPIAAGAILIKDTTGQIGTRTEAQILADIGGAAAGADITAITAGDGIHADTATASGSAEIKLGIPTTLTVSTSSGISAGTHEHAITASADTSGGATALLKADSSGDLKVANFSTGADITVGNDLTLNSAAAVLTIGASPNAVTITHDASDGLTVGGTKKLMFNDATQFVQGISNEILGLGATAEIDLTATAIDINGTVDMSSSVVVGTTLTVGTSIIADAQDGATIGSGTRQFSDLYLADEAQIFLGDNSEITLTHDHNKGITLKHAAAGDGKYPTLTFATGETNIEADDVLGALEFVAPDEASGTADQNLVAAGIFAVSEGDFSDTSNATKLSFRTGVSAVASEKMALSSGGNLTVTGNIAVTGDLTVSGTTTTVDSTTMTVVDPIMHLQTAVGGTALTADTNKDVGIAMQHFSGTAKTAFLGFDDSAGTLTFIPDVTLTSEVVTAGTPGTMVLGSLIIGDAGNVGSASVPAAIAISAAGVVALSATTEASAVGTAALTVAGGIGVGKDMWIGDDIVMASDGAVIKLGDGQDVTLTHVADTAIMLNTSMALRWRDATLGINSSTNGQLDIYADVELEITSPIVDIDASTSVNVSNDLKLDSDSAVLGFGAGNDTTITHTNGSGILLSGTEAKLAFTQTDFNEVIYSSADGQLDIDATDKLQIATTLVEVSNDVTLLSDSAVLGFGASTDVTVTHVADSGLTLKNTSTGAGTPFVLTVQSMEADIAVDDVIGQIDFQAINEGQGSDAITVAAGVAAVSEGDFSASSNATRLVFKTGSSEPAAEKASISSSGNLNLRGTEVMYGASNTTVGVAMTKVFSGSIGTDATANVLIFKAADGSSGPTGATNFMGGEIVLSLKQNLGTPTYETKKIMIHHDGDPSADGTDVFFTEYATLGTEIGETLSTAMGDADGTNYTTNGDKHIFFKIENSSGTATLDYSGVAHLIEVPGDS